MRGTLGQTYRKAFWGAVQRPESAEPLREAAVRERLTEWTRALTGVTVATCRALGWAASAKGHLLELLPVARSEYLALDVMAFPGGTNRWQFPAAVIELENGCDEDKIAYSLWKVLCVRADLRIVFCYRRRPEDAAPLVRRLRDEVIHAMALAGRMSLEGETLIVVGNRNESATFPYGFFKWWKLDTNTGDFDLMK